MFGVEIGWPFQERSCVTSAGMANGIKSIRLRDISDHAVYVRLPSLHAEDGQYGVHSVVLLAVNGLHVESVDFENAKDVAVFHQPLRNAVAVVPHVVCLLVERQPVEGAEIHHLAGCVAL